MSARSFRLIAAVTFLLLLLPFPRFIAHTSPDPAVLGCYSTSFFHLLVAYAGVLIVALAGLILAWRTSRSLASQLAVLAIGVRRRRWALIPLLVGPPVLLVFIIDRMQEYTVGRSAVFQLSFLALVLLLDSMLLLTGRTGHDLTETGVRMTLFSLSVVFVLGFAEFTLRRFPFLIPDVARPHLAGGGMFLRSDLVFDKPIRVGYHYRPLQNRWVEYWASNGDLYSRLAGKIKPLSPEEDTLLAHVHFVTDENGYPNQPPLRGQYNIVATGDSFAVPGVVAVPWPVLLEQSTDCRVLNLAMPGYGPQAEVEAVKLYGLVKQPTWVIMAYFEGNDLTIEAPGYEAKRQSGLSWTEYDLRKAGPYRSSVAIQTLWHGVVDPLYQAWKVAQVTVAGRRVDEDYAAYRYPVTVHVGETERHLAFYDAYVSALTASRDDIERSRNFELTTMALLDLKREAEATGAHVLLVYIPSKLHVHWPYLRDHPSLARVLAGVQPMVLKPDGYLSQTGGEVTPQLIEANIDAQVAALEGFALRNGSDFLDLTPAFQAKAAEGVEQYYFADTHWNAAGHRLAAEVVTRWLRDFGGLESSGCR